MKYPKIHSLWKREGWYFDQDKKNSPDYQKGRQSFLIGDYAEIEFGNIKLWSVEEKIDGTNIQVIYKDGKVSIAGRTDNAQLPVKLLNYLQNTFTESMMAKVFARAEEKPYPHVIVFGEGYGEKIQGCGSNYREGVGFMLFDIWIGGWWLQRIDCFHLAKQLDVPMAPQIGFMDTDRIMEFVKSQPLSLCSRYKQVMEGVVCRPAPLVLFRNGIPIMFKLKCKEFINEAK